MLKNPRTRAECMAEAAKLREMKPRVRKYGASGNNHEAIEVQIAVLEEGLDENAIENRWGTTAAEEDEDEHLYDAAIEACNWAAGWDGEMAPSESWAPLVSQ